MSREFPFDLPRHAIEHIEGVTTPLWKRYADGWTTDSSIPLALECLNDFGLKLVALNAGLDAIIDAHCQDCPSSVQGSNGIWGVHHALEALTDALAALVTLAIENLPHDPVMRRLIAEAEKHDKRRLSADK
jgi:hypothetical protein